MCDSLQHGGPDDSGIFQEPSINLFLGHRRLALIDLSPAGHQPMQDPLGRLTLVYNGEIYNFKELRAELIAHGKSFHSQSDTEVIIQAYLHWGVHSFARFNGMFALALYDKLEKKLILARDHAGIKPLYYSIQGDNLFFASEVKAFTSLKPDWKKRSDWKIYFLAFGHLPEPITTLEGVQPLTKGSYLIFDLASKKYQITKYDQRKHRHSKKISPEEILECTRNVLQAAVQRHLISDAPIGLFLSGGIDSSLLTLLAQPVLADHLKTLSIYFAEAKYSEKKYQDIIIQKSGAKHQSFLVSKKEFDDSMTDVFQAMDQPTTDGINSYFISKYAHELGLKAVLSGIGADELFGGYPSIKKSVWKRSLQLLPSQAYVWTARLGGDKFKRIKYLVLNNSTGDYLFYRGLHDADSIAYQLDCSSQEAYETLASLEPINWNGESAKEKAADIEYHLYMQNQLLRDTDFMSMWHSLEVRVPFLDKEVVELACGIPDKIRFSDVKPKYALTEAFKDILPVEIWNRPKQGFTFPFSLWLQSSPWAKPANDREINAFNRFKAGNLSWSGYWSIKLLGIHSRVS
jgi:asparagine synthase (glutamine-hydrolysing)